MRKPDRLVAELSPGESRVVDAVLDQIQRHEGRTITRKQLAMEGVRFHAARLGISIEENEPVVSISTAQVERFKANGGNRTPLLRDRLSAVLGLRGMTVARLARLLRSQWTAQHLSTVIRGQRAPSARLYLSLKRWLRDAYPYVTGQSEVLPAPRVRRAA